jgi:hypothetical protein
LTGSASARWSFIANGRKAAKRWQLPNDTDSARPTRSGVAMEVNLVSVRRWCVRTRAEMEPRCTGPPRATSRGQRRVIPCCWGAPWREPPGSSQARAPGGASPKGIPTWISQSHRAGTPAAARREFGLSASRVISQTRSLASRLQVVACNSNGSRSKNSYRRAGDPVVATDREGNTRSRAGVDRLRRVVRPVPKRCRSTTVAMPAGSGGKG